MKVSTPSAVRRPIEVMGVFNENAGRMAISAITLSELCHGAEKSAKVAQNLAVVEEFASRLEVLPCMAKASQHYGAIRTALDQVGRPIGVNDLHIAAHAQRRADPRHQQPRRVRAGARPVDGELGPRPGLTPTGSWERGTLPSQQPTGGASDDAVLRENC